MSERIDTHDHDEPIFDYPAPDNLLAKAEIMENCMNNGERATPGDLGVWALTLHLCAARWEQERADRLAAEARIRLLEQELEAARNFRQSVDAALNSGDGVYRP